jgi:uncharacterized protein (DUF2235 family)
MASLIVCLDGTWNNADSAEAQTNIGLLASMIDPKPDRGIPAQIYYDAGVGTSGSTTNRLAGGLLGKGLSTNILEAYRFLSLNYRPGDRIYIFGYSRGAYTARSLCGFLSASGLLRADMCDHSNQDFAWKYYLTRPKKRFPADKEHLRRLTHPDVRVRFLGVFDTVGSLGIPRTWLNWIGRRAFQFHDTDVCPIIDYACQALAIDEHRIEFEASVWRQPQHRGYLAVEQVWFPGVHANVGGGYEDRGLSDLTLDWMMKRLRKFCPEVVVSTADLRPNHHGILYDPRNWLYWRSIWRPLMRLINRCAIKNCRGIRLAHIAPHSKPIGEMLHWSALARFMDTRKARGRERYAPANLRAALESVRAGTTLVVGVDGEPGTLLPPSMRPTAEMRLH